MFKDTEAFSSYSANNVADVKDFYVTTLGLVVTEENDMLMIDLATGGKVVIYPKGPGHQPAAHTVLNFPVDDIDAAVDELTAKGVAMVQYNSDDIPQDEKGICRGRAAGQGPDVAWFTDPAGNTLSVLQG